MSSNTWNLKICILWYKKAIYKYSNIWFVGHQQNLGIDRLFITKCTFLQHEGPRTDQNIHFYSEFAKIHIILKIWPTFFSGKKIQACSWPKLLVLQFIFYFYNSNFIKVYYCIIILPQVHWFSFYLCKSDIEFYLFRNLINLEK